MPRTESQRVVLFAARESRGWSWHADFICAPYRSIGLLGSMPWASDLPDFHDRMQGRLRRIEGQPSHSDDPQDHRQVMEEVMEDTQELVDVLAAMLSVKWT